MDLQFETSTQSRSWLFSEETLKECRELVIAPSDKTIGYGSSSSSPIPVQKFASGFYRRRETKTTKNGGNSVEVGSSGLPSQHSQMESTWKTSAPYFGSLPSLSVNEEDLVVRFHAHQIGYLVGPDALLPELQRGYHVLDTAIVLFRRFFLSNSVTNFEPRRVAAASVLLAGKVPGTEEQKIDVRLVERATALTHLEAKKSPFFSCCCSEVNFVSSDDIVDAEMQLLSGLNYELMCFHPHRAIRVLASDLLSFIQRRGDDGVGRVGEEYQNKLQNHQRRAQHRNNHYEQAVDLKKRIHLFHDRSRMLAHMATIFTDLPFLFPPGHIAFATMALAVESEKSDEKLIDMNEYLRTRFPNQESQQLKEFEEQVSKIILHLRKSAHACNLTGALLTEIDRKSFRSVVEKLNSVRHQRKAESIEHSEEQRSTIGKRKERDTERDDSFKPTSSPCKKHLRSGSRKAAKVTPNPH